MTLEQQIQDLRDSYSDLLRKHEQLRAELAQAAVTVTPIGSIVAFSGASPEPLQSAGWLLCDGAEVAADEYPELALVLGSTWGRAAAGKLKLPDLRGLFLRALERGSGRDEARMLGSFQMDALQNHTHKDLGHSHHFYSPERVVRDDDQADDEHSTWSTDTGGTYSTEKGHADLSEPTPFGGGEVRVAAETRPKNAAVDFYIRCKLAQRL